MKTDLLSVVSRAITNTEESWNEDIVIFVRDELNSGARPDIALAKVTFDVSDPGQLDSGRVRAVRKQHDAPGGVSNSVLATG